MAGRDLDGEKVTTAVRTSDFENISDDQHGAELGNLSKTNSGQNSNQTSAGDDDVATGGLSGVERIRATTQAWTKPWLITAFAFIWLVTFTDSYQQQMSGSFLPYVTSSFSLHGLVATTSIVSTVVAGISKIPLARLMDMAGRNEGLMVMLFITVIALVLMAACGNVTTYAAGQAFYWVGMNGVGFVLQVFQSDTTTLRNRFIWLGFTTTAYIPNAFTGPLTAQAFLSGSSWRWGYGAFAIIIPTVCAPLIAILAVNTRRAKAKGLIRPRRETKSQHEKRSVFQWCKYWIVEIDLVGMILVMAGLSCLFLPLSLASYQAEKWRSPSIIVLLCVGAVSLVLFVLYEKRATKTFIRYELLKNRNILAACLLGGNTWISFYCYKLYFNSYLQVVYGVSVSQAGYIASIFTIVSCACGPLFGLLFRWSDRYKWMGLTAVPVYILFSGLMIKFRAPGTHIGLVIMCEVFTSLTAAALVPVEQAAIMSSIHQRDLSASLALLGVVTSIGGAVGQAISGAIWTNTLPYRLAEYLPEELKADAALIYGDITVQLGYEWGSPGRDAIIRAYGETQKYMLIASVAASVGSLVWVSIMKDNTLKDKEQTTGVLL